MWWPALLRRLAALAVVVATVWAADRAAPPRNVVVLLVDTLRADHLGLYGYARPTSPNLDRLARDAVVFTRARSQAACTFPSVNSLLTSRHPGRFLGQGFANFTIPADVPTAAELLGAAGFTTFAASASGIVRATPSRVNPKGGFDRGFGVFDESCLDQSAACINDRFLAFLDGAPGRFFAYLHYMDPHHPYAPPRAWRRRFATAPAGAPWAIAGNPDPIERAIGAGTPVPGTAADVQLLIDLYDDEIAYWDGELARLFAELERRGRLDDTLVVLAADHGEMFLEHDDIKHCRQLWDTVTHTPLVVWLPGHGGRRVTTAVQNVDILPTVLDYVGVAPPDWRADGRSLRPLVAGGGEPRPAFSAQELLRSANDDRLKVLQDLRTGQVRVFDLVRDPAERVDLAGTPTDAQEVLQVALREWVTTHDTAGAAGSARAAKDVADALRALGYME